MRRPISRIRKCENGDAHNAGRCPKQVISEDIHRVRPKDDHGWMGYFCSKEIARQVNEASITSPPRIANVTLGQDRTL